MVESGWPSGPPAPDPPTVLSSLVMAGLDPVMQVATGECWIPGFKPEHDKEGEEAAKREEDGAAEQGWRRLWVPASTRLWVVSQFEMQP